ncbi:MAG: peptidylprolyl isomerase [Alphaproteobacteria bacterium]
MLQQFQKIMSTAVAKLLFALLLASFAVWGIGDIFRGSSGQKVAAWVGEEAIPLSEIDHGLQQEAAQMRQMVGREFSVKDAVAMGLLERVMNQSINRRILQHLAKDFNINFSDAVVAEKISQLAAFRNEQGVFDKEKIKTLLARVNINEREFTDLIRQQMLADLLQPMIEQVVFAPHLLQESVYRYTGEKRTADLLTLPPQKIDSNIIDPTALSEWFEKNKERFRTPAYKKLRYAEIGEDLLDNASLNITDEQLKTAFEEQKDSLAQVEQRHIVQLVLQDEKLATNLAEEAKNAPDFAAFLQSKGQKAVDLGFVKKTAMNELLASKAFAMTEGEVSPPVHTEFGWHILKLVAIKPAQSAEFEQVKEQLTQQLLAEKKASQHEELVQKIDSAVGSGASLTELAEEFKLKIAELPPLDKLANDQAGKPVLPQEKSSQEKTSLKPAILQMFQDEQTNIRLLEAGKGHYVVMEVAETIAPTIPALEAVKKAVEDAYSLEVGKGKAEGMASAIAFLTNPASTPTPSLHELAAALKLEANITALKPMERDGGAEEGKSTVSPTVIASVFELAAVKNTQMVRDENTAYVVRLSGIIPAPAMEQHQETATALAARLKESLGVSLLQQTMQATRKQIGVKINDALLTATYGKADGAEPLPNHL